MMAKQNRPARPTVKADTTTPQDVQAPLLVSVAIDRASGRWAPAFVVNQQDAEGDVRTLLAVLRQLEDSLQNDLVRMAEERGKKAAGTKAPGQEVG